MRLSVLVVLAGLLSFPPGISATEDPIPLVLRRVVLYKNGMGFFEHSGKIRSGEQVELALSSSQLNDLLKSLTVLDLDGGQVAEVTYDSSPPISRRLAESPIQLDSQPDVVRFLNQFRGAGVAIRSSGGFVSGQLLGAEKRKTTHAGEQVTESIFILLFTDSGELRTFELNSIGALRLTDKNLADRLESLLDTAATRLQHDVRRVRIRTNEAGLRNLYVSYISESPIWKASYRLVLDEDRKPLLQGWAIVDNTTEMDWEDVELSLVSGAPVSFVQNLSDRFMLVARSSHFQKGSR